MYLNVYVYIYTSMYMYTYVRGVLCNSVLFFITVRLQLGKKFCPMVVVCHTIMEVSTCDVWLWLIVMGELLCVCVCVCVYTNHM